MQTNAASSATRREVQPVSNRAAESSSKRQVSGTSERDGERYELLGELATGGMATVYL
ncbi:hypothetical protein HWN75_25795, partial [Escherichia coli]|nr:hypothetical protein [Escherichia coli]